MKINSLHCKNFKAFENRSFTFADRTDIQADNYSGKTSIAEGILFGLFGTTLTGSPRTDHFIRRGAKKAEVGVVFTLDGKEHSIERVQGKSSEVYLDGQKVAQSDIDRLIGTKEKFLAAYWPGYFTSQSEKDGREMVMSLIKPPKQQDVVATLDAAYQSLLTFDLRNPDASAKDTRAEMKVNEAELNRLEGRLEAVQERANQEIPLPTEFDDTELKSLQARLESMQSDTAARIKELRAQISSMGREYQTIKAQIEKVPDAPYKPGDACPVCAQTMAGDALEHVLSHHTHQSVEIQKRNNAKVTKCQELIGDANGLKKELEQLENAYIESNVNDIKARIAELQHEQSEAHAHNSWVKRLVEEAESAKAQVSDIEAQIQSSKDAIFQGGETLKAIAAYRAKLAEMQVGQLKQYLNRVDIELFKITKTTGEIKDCFTITYDGREYKSLSYSEQIRAGLEISNLFNKAMGTTYPVFIDNSESITHFDAPDTEQLFTAKVVEGAELTVESKSEVEDGAA